MKQYVLTVYFCLVATIGLLAQTVEPQQALVLRKGTIGASLPFAGVPKVLTDIYRPYAELGYAFTFYQNETNLLWLEGRVGYFNHRFVQQVIPIMVEGTYERRLGEKFSAFAGLGIGYLHAFPHEGRFELNESGTYEPVNAIGRAQFGANITLGGRYAFDDTWSLSLGYRALLQMPFVNTYVPLLPYGIVQFGIHYAL